MGGRRESGRAGEREQLREAGERERKERQIEKRERQENGRHNKTILLLIVNPTSLPRLIERFLRAATAAVTVSLLTLFINGTRASRPPQLTMNS